MKIALGQCNPVVGDITGNTAKIAAVIDRAERAGAELVVFSELSVIGYPPQDLLRKERFVADVVTAVESLAKNCKKIAALVGSVCPSPREAGKGLQNVAVLLSDGKVQDICVKSLLPSYDVFDETRYFEPADRSCCIEFKGCRIGVTICEDFWDTVALGRKLYGPDPIAMLIDAGAEMIINMAANPYQIDKASVREELLIRQARRAGAMIVYVNQVGGNDELIFEGGSCVIAPDGEVIGRAKSFEEDLLVLDTESPPRRREDLGGPMERCSVALKFGLRDYVRKCGFNSVVLGLSGGIDSGVVATLAADAIGPENVYAIAMPGRYSSDRSLTDAEMLAKNLGIHYQVIPIELVHAAFAETLGEVLTGVADENVQARIRGAILMGLSNAYGHLPLATGNKSELSCGYCTLYGDMCGGLAPIGDLLKTQVYHLAEQLNAESGSERIPQSMITKVPSAELKPNQTDQDKLPPYDILDPILARYIEGDETPERIIADGVDAEIVHRVVSMVDAAEYKRKQAAPVLKVTGRAFGTGWRIPIAQRYVPSKDSGSA
ncbi:MAG: NAD+ synthase [Planctomycetota bacterium]